MAIYPGDCIAQLLLLPSCHSSFACIQLATVSADLAQQVMIYIGMMLQLRDNGKEIQGLLDTGADRSIIATKDWPTAWPVQASA